MWSVWLLTDDEIEHADDERDLVAEAHHFGVLPLLLQVFDSPRDLFAHLFQLVVHLLQFALGLCLADELLTATSGARAHVAGERGPFAPGKVQAWAKVGFEQIYIVQRHSSTRREG